MLLEGGDYVIRWGFVKLRIWVGTLAFFSFIKAEKIQAKLAGWRFKLFFRVGRLVLIKTAIAPIADYHVQYHALPIKVYNAIDNKVREFLWGSTEEKRKMLMVNW